MAAVKQKTNQYEVKQKTNQYEDIEFVECDCCGLIEECSPAYIYRIREKFEGHWLCGLCSEAVKYERLKSSPEHFVTTNEALIRHMKFNEQFRSSTPPENPTEDLIIALKHLLLRSLDSPRKNNGSKTCFSTLSNGEVKNEV